MSLHHRENARWGVFAYIGQVDNRGTSRAKKDVEEGDGENVDYIILM